MSDSKLNTAEKQQKPVAKKIDKIILSLALIIPIAFVAYRYFTAPPAGFCVAQNRFVTDEVFIEKVRKEAYLGSRKFDGKNYSLINCCHIERLNRSFISKITRVDEGVLISFEYDRSEKQTSVAPANTTSISSVWFNSCAEWRNMKDF